MSLMSCDDDTWLSLNENDLINLITQLITSWSAEKCIQEAFFLSSSKEGKKQCFEKPLYLSHDPI